MRQYSKVSTSIWGSQKFRDLPTDRDRLYYHYCLSCRHQNSAGVFLLPDEYAVADLYWSADDVSLAREALIASGLIHYDGSTREVFVDGWFKFNPACNDRHAKGVDGYIEQTRSDDLRQIAQVQFDEAELLRQKDKTTKTRNRQIAELNRSGNSGNGKLSQTYRNAVSGGLKHV